MRAKTRFATKSDARNAAPVDAPPKTPKKPAS